MENQHYLCPFLKATKSDIFGEREETFNYCIGKECMAYHETALSIECRICGASHDKENWWKDSAIEEENE